MSFVELWSWDERNTYMPYLFSISFPLKQKLQECLISNNHCMLILVHCPCSDKSPFPTVTWGVEGEFTPKYEYCRTNVMTWVLPIRNPGQFWFALWSFLLIDSLSRVLTIHAIFAWETMNFPSWRVVSLEERALSFLLLQEPFALQYGNWGGQGAHGAHGGREVPRSWAV